MSGSSGSGASSAWLGRSLDLHPYHLLYLAGVIVVVVAGTLWSWLFDTNGYHLRIAGMDHLSLLHMAPSSSPTAHSRFLPPSDYFAQKGNVLNTYFVKRGWAWNISIWLLQLVCLRSTYHVAVHSYELHRKRKLDKLIRHKYRLLRRQFEAENASAETTSFPDETLLSSSSSAALLDGPAQPPAPAPVSAAASAPPPAPASSSSSSAPPPHPPPPSPPPPPPPPQSQAVAPSQPAQAHAQAQPHPPPPSQAQASSVHPQPSLPPLPALSPPPSSRAQHQQQQQQQAHQQAASSSAIQLHPDISALGATAAGTTSQRRNRKQLQPQQQDLLLKQAQQLLHKERERKRSHGAGFVTAPYRASFMRLLWATASWYFFTTWFFGPAIMVRLYQWTGGQCMPVPPVSPAALSYAPSFYLASREPVHASFCTDPHKLITQESHPHFFQEGDRIAARVAASGGFSAQWKGGHDVSGHTFLLVLSILWLMEEITPFLPHLVASIEELYPPKTWWPANPFQPFAYATTAALGLAAPASHRSSPASGLEQTGSHHHTPLQPQIQISSPDLGAVTVGRTSASGSPPLRSEQIWGGAVAATGVGGGSGDGSATNDPAYGGYPPIPVGASNANGPSCPPSFFGGAPPPELAPIIFSPRVHYLALALVLALVGLWMWMLLMTQIYFHTAREKIAGLGAGVAAWLVVRFFTPKT